MRKLILCFVFVCSHYIWAAVPPLFVAKKKLTTEQVKMSLRLPFKNRVEVVRSWDKKKALRQIARVAFNEKESLQMRWRAVTALGQIDKSSPHIIKALQSEEWFMRNAGLIALKGGSRAEMIKWSKKLLKDPALVVRTASVQLIQDMNLTEVEGDLWQALESSDNFRKGQSLWVRTSIAGALAQFAKKGQEKRFISLLKDEDTRLHPVAIKALEKTARLKVNPKTIAEKRSAWLNWKNTY